MLDKLDFITEKYDELAQKVSDPDVINNQPVWQKHIKEIRGVHGQGAGVIAGMEDDARHRAQALIHQQLHFLSRIKDQAQGADGAGEHMQQALKMILGAEAQPRGGNLTADIHAFEAGVGPDQAQIEMIAMLGGQEVILGGHALQQGIGMGAVLDGVHGLMIDALIIYAQFIQILKHPGGSFGHSSLRSFPSNL